MDTKPLPPPAFFESDLPQLPSDFNAPQDNAPQLPPKHSNGTSSRPPQLDLMPSFDSIDPLALNLPGTPTSPNDPTIAAESTKPKKSNPLNDLIDTEKAYVEQLTGIIRKVAAAWSRSNLPPPELDTMFRSIEGVYKANRSLLNKLKEIGANPSSPKALGDLLMRWIDDLEAPYTTYCTRYAHGFDTWDPIASNSRLPQALATFSETCPPTAASETSGVWTLDSLFLLPKARIKYYRKLYSRLLKSTAPGRSDHRLLVGALEKLDKLLGTIDHREDNVVGSPAPLPPVDPAPPPDDVPSPQDEIVIGGPPPYSDPVPPRSSDIDTFQSSSSSSLRGSSASGGPSERNSRETANTSFSRASSSTMNQPVSELEHRLSTDRTLDIFSMTPKAVRLQINPPGLTFTRELRFSKDVTITFTPRATGTEIVLRRAHIFLLSDLFLVCERMTPEEQSSFKSNGPDMWLCYPPLAGKVLRVAEIPGEDNVFTIAIMRKETLTVRAESAQARNMMLAEFRECIDFAGTVGPISKQAPPPMPSLNIAALNINTASPPRPNSNVSASGSWGPPSRDSGISPRNSGVSPPGSRIASPFGRNDRMIAEGEGMMRASTLPPAHQMQQPGQPPMRQQSYGPGPPMGRSSTPGGPPPHGPHQFPPHQGPPHPGQGPPHFGHGPPPHHGPGLPQHPGQGPPHPGQGSPHPGQGPPHHPGQAPPFHPRQGPPMHPQSFQPPQSIPPFQGHPSHHGPPGGPGPMRGGGPGPGFMHGGPGPQGQPRPPSEPPHANGLRKSQSTRSFHDLSQEPLPPPPSLYNANISHHSASSLHAPQARPMLPSLNNARIASAVEPMYTEPSPPPSPTEEPQHRGPVTSTVSASMKCKVFLKQQHQQWKSLGSAKLKLYHESPTNVKQLVVEADTKDKAVLISTIVLSDGVERVGKTGVAIELSDKGARTGIVYMIQLRNEKSAGGLFDSLLAGSDRVVA